MNNIPIDLNELEMEWKKTDPDMNNLKGYGLFVQDKVQQAEDIEIPAA